MATIYQKNILSMKNAVKDGFDAFATGIANVTAQLEFPTKTFGHDKAGERRNDTNSLISKVQHPLITENICSNTPEKNNSILPTGHNRGLGGFFFHKGFTLIELLVVVLIIGILAAVALPQYQKAVLKSRFVQTQVSIRNLYDALKVYHMANGTYPNDLSVLDISLPGTYSENNKTIVFSDFYCVYYYANSGVTDSIQCLLNDTMGIGSLGTRIFLEGGLQGKLYCTASNSSEKAKSVCVALGGKNPFDSGSGQLHYEMP